MVPALQPKLASPARGPAVWGWWVLLAAVLLAGRWSLIWLPHEIYPDESQLIAGAITLRHDPLFWRSVDGGTAGPLDYFAVIPAGFFPGTTAYALARITAALLYWGTLVAAGEALALATGLAITRIAVLPALIFGALTTSPEFGHYSTELVPGFLLALAVLLIVRQNIRPARRNLWAAALLLGAVPLAKLQAGPIAAGLGLLLVTGEIAAKRPRSVALLAGAALLPLLLTCGVLTLTGQMEHMIIPYFLQNLLYAGTGRLPVDEVGRLFVAQSVTNGYHALWLAGVAVFCTGAGWAKWRSPSPLRRHALLSAALLALTVLCIFSPGRPYHHYLNLLTLPVTLLAGICLGLTLLPGAGAPPDRQKTLWLTGLFLLCTLLPQLALRLSGRPDPFDYYNRVLTARDEGHDRLVTAIKNLSAPGDTLGLWGWRSSLYVETGLPQATRLAHTESLLVEGPWQKFYLRRYYEDLQASAPAVFVDATGPGNFRFTNRAATGHEIYPLLRAWVRDHYRLVEDVDGVRVYARRNRTPGLRPSE